MGLKKAKDAAVLHPVTERDYVRDTQGLMAQLQDADSSVRRWAARDLAQCPEAVTALGAALTREIDGSVREALFTSLCTLGGAAAVDALLPLLRSEDANLRNGAIESLAHLPDVVGSRIDQLLQDTDADVRIFTVNLLGELRHARVGHWLQQVLQAETAINVVGAAIEVITEVGTSMHLAPLAAARSRFSDDPFTTFAIDIARTRIEST
ncbi:HEAT repeat protein [Sphaerotilus hippei]|uniref:HEAT repeat protein n=1 Tax=Sphaerotilus hippei TaxID=744406 RepID=A0A318H3J2_9BURK|nr:HEAT repeat domain-containing protein [Sphaerotilus hippei]PXW98010.1 HEAT repeat protein [Sphaerotilus hippei]